MFHFIKETGKHFVFVPQSSNASNRMFSPSNKRYMHMYAPHWNNKGTQSARLSTAACLLPNQRLGSRVLSEKKSRKLLKIFLFPLCAVFLLRCVSPTSSGFDTRRCYSSESVASLKPNNVPENARSRVPSPFRWYYKSNIRQTSKHSLLQKKKQ